MWPDGPGPRRPRSVRGTIVGVGITLMLTGTACGADTRQAGAESKTSATTATSATTRPPATGPVTSQAAGPVGVAVVNFAFMPSPAVVRPGGTVTWTNQDDATHSIEDTSPLATPVSQPLNKGESFSITYAKAGTYPYICGIHNYMQGSVEVKS